MTSSASVGLSRTKFNNFHEDSPKKKNNITFGHHFSVRNISSEENADITLPSLFFVTYQMQIDLRRHTKATSATLKTNSGIQTRLFFVPNLLKKKEKSLNYRICFLILCSHKKNNLAFNSEVVRPE